MGGPVVVWSLTATSGSVRESELVLATEGCFINCHEVVVVVEFVNSWEVSVLLALDLPATRIRVSEAEFVGILILEQMSEDT